MPHAPTATCHAHFIDITTYRHHQLWLTGRLSMQRTCLSAYVLLSLPCRVSCHDECCCPHSQIQLLKANCLHVIVKRCTPVWHTGLHTGLATKDVLCSASSFLTIQLLGFLQTGGSGWVWVCSSLPGLCSTLAAGSATRTSAVSLLTQACLLCVGSAFCLCFACWRSGRGWQLPVLACAPCLLVLLLAGHGVHGCMAVSCSILLLFFCLKYRL